MKKIKDGQVVKLLLDETDQKSSKRFLERIKSVNNEHPALVVVSSIIRDNGIFYILADREGKVIMNGSGEEFNNFPFYVSQKNLKPFNIPTEIVSVGETIVNTNIPDDVIQRCISKVPLSKQIAALGQYARKNNLIFQALELNPYKKFQTVEISEEIEKSIKSTLDGVGVLSGEKIESP